MNLTKKQLAAHIDHTLLKPTASENDIVTLCKEAREYGFAAVCVNPCFVPLAVKELKDCQTLVCTVVGFPLGSTTTTAKAFETGEAVENGAREIDMVINTGALKEQREDTVLADIKEVVQAALYANSTAKVKVIIETCYLTREEIIRACQLAQQAGAHFVKTSTGFGSAGATVDNIRLMHEIVGSYLGIKASGGIKTTQQALDMINAGATRIGTSSGVEIIKNYK